RRAPPAARFVLSVSFRFPGKDGPGTRLQPPTPIRKARSCYLFFRDYEPEQRVHEQPRERGRDHRHEHIDHARQGRVHGEVLGETSYYPGNHAVVTGTTEL